MPDPIKDPTTHFSIADYPLVATEVAALRPLVSGMPAESMVAIIISFLKNHAISTEFVVNNHPAVALIQSRSISISHMENLFADAKDNKPFQREFEEYLRLQLTDRQPDKPI